VAVEALLLVLAAGEQVEEQAERRPRLPGTAVLAVDAVGEHERLHLLGFVVAVEEVAKAARQERGHLGDLIAGDAAEALSDAKRLHDAGKPCGVDVGRRLEKEGLEIARELLQAGVDPREGRCVPRRQALQLRDRRAHVRPPREDVAVGKRHLERGIAGHHAQAVRAQAEVADDLGPEHARDVRRGGGPAARCDLLRDAAPAEDLAALQDEHAEPPAREIGGRGEAVVAPAHHHGVGIGSQSGPGGYHARARTDGGPRFSSPRSPRSYCPP
jgi:hypothetical protein